MILHCAQLAGKTGGVGSKSVAKDAADEIGVIVSDGTMEWPIMASNVSDSAADEGGWWADWGVVATVEIVVNGPVSGEDSVVSVMEGIGSSTAFVLGGSGAFWSSGGDEIVRALVSSVIDFLRF